MKIVVNPTYEHLRKFIESVPDTFEREGRIIYSGRNLIKVMEVDGIEINVKRYGIPALANRIVYSFFRTPKGKRAFEYPQMLLQKGVETPAPIAYIEERKCGLINYDDALLFRSEFQGYRGTNRREYKYRVGAYALCDYQPATDDQRKKYGFMLIPHNISMGRAFS